MPLPLRVAIQQRVLPAYRAPLFDLLAAHCTGGLFVFAGKPLPQESIATTEVLQTAHLTVAQNRNVRDPSSGMYLCWQDGLLTFLRTTNPDTLVLEANPRYLSNWLALRWMRTRHKPVLGWGLGAPRAARPPMGTLWRVFLRQFDGLLAYSRRGAAEYRALGIPAERVFAVGNAAAPRPKASLPSRPPDFAGQPRLLFVGRLQARKRLDLLFSACAALPINLQPALTIVGDGPARAGFERAAQQTYPQARFTGDLRGAPLEAEFRAADLFVLPGTGGLAVQQALSFGLPVIVAQGDGSQDDLVRPENGWQIPPNDLAALQAALTQALRDPVRLRQMGAESYRVAVEEANLEAVAANFAGALAAIGEGQR
ncbi:MAG: hypothetical protein OHK0052_03670 [Anaerolineales bacterium]